MPEIDLQTLFRGGSGRKIVCETLLDHPPNDAPADSFRLPVKEQFDWVDRNAVLERRHSSKASLFSPCSSSSKRRPPYPNLKSKRSLIGLPKRPHSGQLCTTPGPGCRPASIRFFPKPAPKSTAPLHDPEPSSPKVSCIGRVRSKKSRDAALRPTPPPAPERRPARSASFLARFLRVFACRAPAPGESSESSKHASEPSPSPSTPSPPAEAAPSAAAVARLGTMKKFASGRRAEMELHVAK